jgi:hypothetical protein
MEIKNVREAILEISKICKNNGLQGMCIISQDTPEGKREVGSMLVGNIVTTSMNIMRTMNADPRIETIYKVAAENYTIFKELDQRSENCVDIDISDLINGFSRN